MYNRYIGNTGRVIRIDDRSGAPDIASAAHTPAAPTLRRTNAGKPFRFPAGLGGGSGGLLSGLGGGSGGLLGGLGGGLGGLLNGLGGKLNLGALETEDIILMLILFLMYRESGDVEMLVALGALLFL